MQRILFGVHNLDSTFWISTKHPNNRNVIFKSIRLFAKQKTANWHGRPSAIIKRRNPNRCAQKGNQNNNIDIDHFHFWLTLWLFRGIFTNLTCPKINSSTESVNLFSLFLCNSFGFRTLTHCFSYHHRISTFASMLSMHPFSFGVFHHSPIY